MGNSISYFDGMNQYVGLLPNMATYNNSYTLPYPPSKPGFTFDSWLEDATDIKLKANISILWPFDKPVNLFAIFIANSYNVSYYSNISQNPILSSISITYNNTYIFPTPPSYTGYTFNGWYLNSGLTGTVYSSGTQIKWTFAENKSLYAKFIEQSYSLTYSLDGGTLTGQPSSVKYNSVYSIPSPTKKTYTFNGWYTDSNLITPIASSGTWTLTSDLTLYAKFTINAGYDLTYNTNDIGGTGKTYNTVIFESTPIIPIPKAVGYIFNGWYDSISGGTKKINNDGTGGYTMPAAATTLFAQWTPLSGIRLSYLQDTYGIINNDNKISISEYQNRISKYPSSRTALSGDFKGKGPDL